MPTVLLLGATSEMALAMASTYAENGYSIQLAARKPERLNAVCADLRIRFNIACEALPFDATDFSSHQLFFDQLNTKPDVTVCVFGFLGEQNKAEKDWKETETIIHSNYTGAVSILNIIAEYYAAQNKGCIIGISSVAGERGRQSNYIYGSAKAGFTAYLSGLRNRLYQHQVHVLSVLPGFAYTRMTENMKLPPLLTAQPEAIAKKIYAAAEKKKNILYVKGIWRWIMLIIKLIPEPVFKKLKL